MKQGCVSLAIGFAISIAGVLLTAQTPTLPQGAAQPGPPMPRMQMPPRDGALADAPTGTARIRGRVVSADTGAPLRRAQVRINAAEVRVMRTVNTDVEGRFEVADLPAGRYFLMVGRNGRTCLAGRRSRVGSCVPQTDRAGRETLQAHRYPDCNARSALAAVKATGLKLADVTE